MEFTKKKKNGLKTAIWTESESESMTAGEKLTSAHGVNSRGSKAGESHHRHTTSTYMNFPPLSDFIHMLF